MPCIVCVDESGNLTANNLSGTNTGDQTITLTGDVTGSGTGSFTTTISNDAVTFAKMQNIATDKLIGRDTAGTGDPEEIGVGGGIEFTGSGAIQRSALTGDVTASAGSGSTTIADNTVNFAKMQNIATDKLVGRDTTGTGDPEEIGVGGGIEFTGSGAIQRSALTGDVTASAGANSTTIASDAVTFAKLQNIANQRVIGRNTSGSGDPEEVSLTQLLDWVGSAANGDMLLRSGGSWTRLPKGTDGDLLTMSSGAPTWTAASSLHFGDWQYVDSEEVSSGDTVEFQDFEAKFDYMISYSNVGISTYNGMDMRFGTVISGSMTWHTANYSWGSISGGSTGSTGATGGALNSIGYLSVRPGADAGSPSSGFVQIFNPKRSSTNHSTIWQSQFREGGSTQFLVSCGGGQRNNSSNEVIDGVRLYLNSATFSSGLFTLYRRRNQL